MIEKWRALSTDKKILNLAAELSRAKSWLIRHDSVAADLCLERALELVDLTIETEAGKGRLSFIREFLRFREMLAGFYLDSTKNGQDLPALFKSLLNLNSATHSLHLEF